MAKTELLFDESTDPLEQIGLEQERIDNPELFDNAITPDKFKDEDPLKTITVPEEDTTELDDIVDSSASSIQGLTDANAAQLKAEQDSAATQKGIIDVINQASGLEGDVQAAGEESGLTEATKQLAQLNAQAKSLLRGRRAIPLELQEKIAGTGTTEGGLAPQTAGALRRNALKALTLAQQSDIATANYTAAKDKAQQIIDIKYKPLEQNLKLLQQQYLFNKDNLERIDKKQADALATDIARQETELKDKKDLEADINAVALEATKNNAPASVIRAISGAKTIGEALALSTGFMTDELSNLLKQAQLDKVKADTIRADKKFEQDKIEFGEEIALKNRVQAFNESKEKFSDDGNIGKTVKVGDDTFMWNTETQNYDIKVGGDGNVSKKDVENINSLQDKTVLINNVLDDTNIDNITGTGTFASVKFLNNAIKGTTQDSILRIEQIINKETLDTLINLKAKGGTLGALSEKEADMLRSAATSLGGARDLDRKGQVIGYQMSKTELEKQINNIKFVTERAMIALQGSSDDSFDESFNIKDDTGLFDFNNGGSGTPTATTDAKKVASAIGEFESGGNYQARGPVVTRGQYKGEKAAGKYQIMPGNIPNWSREALGESISLQTFLDSPDLQDKIAEHKMGQILAKYGNVEDVASIWFSGIPVERAGNAQDDLGTTVPQYISNITSIFNSLA